MNINSILMRKKKENIHSYGLALIHDNIKLIILFIDNAIQNYINLEINEKKNKNGKYLLKCTNFYANVELTK